MRVIRMRFGLHHNQKNQREFAMIDYSKFQKSLMNLTLQYNNYLHSDQRADLSELDKEGIKESTIQRFEICYDCLWKVLKRYLMEGLGLPDVPNSPKPVFRLAHENKLLTAPITAWLSYADMRTEAALDYDGKKAENCLIKMGDFILDAKDMYKVMTGNEWH